jgi:LDH2 family malate/lactate/ureidoglycolate dehydrogenase
VSALASNATPARTKIAPLGELDRFCQAVLSAAGADDPTADAATRAMMHGSRLGVDSHGVRLLDHYVTVLQGGRVNPRPHMRLASEFGAVATLDADDGHGALAGYTAMEHALDRAGRLGIGAVAIRNSSHFGPAGSFALAAAEQGCIGLVMCNSDSFVRLYEGAMRFHGTNPIACAVPVEGSRPWLLDMATSAITYNRIQLCRSLGEELPTGVASDAGGRNTRNAEQAEMLAPLGDAFGFKGAGLAGLVEIFSAVLAGARLSFDILPMAGPDLSTPRGVGAFALALRPEALIGAETFQAGMRRYVDELRKSPAREGGAVLAPGDREWAEAERRASGGVPIDPATAQAFEGLAAKFGIDPPFVEAA